MNVVTNWYYIYMYIFTHILEKLYQIGKALFIGVPFSPVEKKNQPNNINWKFGYFDIDTIL